MEWITNVCILLIGTQNMITNELQSATFVVTHWTHDYSKTVLSFFAQSSLGRGKKRVDSQNRKLSLKPILQQGSRIHAEKALFALFCWRRRALSRVFQRCSLNLRVRLNRGKRVNVSSGSAALCGAEPRVSAPPGGATSAPGWWSECPRYHAGGGRLLL